MYRQSYAKIASDSSQSARAREKDALEQAISRLAVARDKGPRTVEAFEATDFTRRLWSIFIADLSDDDNGLPQELRASLISIGMWIRKEADLIDQGQSENFDGLIDINRLIADGLV
jgi:flagellar biosynthesis activator protein FlaF